MLRAQSTEPGAAAPFPPWGPFPPLRDVLYGPLRNAPLSAGGQAECELLLCAAGSGHQRVQVQPIHLRRQTLSASRGPLDPNGA